MSDSRPSASTRVGTALLVAAALTPAIAAAADTKDAANRWVKVCQGRSGRRTGPVLLPPGPDGAMLYLGGELKGQTAYVQAFDPARREWSDFCAARPPAKRGIHPCYQVACDARAGKLYCLSDGSLFTLDLKAKTWQAHGVPAELEGLSWHTAAIDPQARRLVVVGADKRPDNLGWSRTTILDLDSGTWSHLPLPPAAVVEAHRHLVSAREAAIDLVGRIRLAWYREPAGRGTDAERKALAERCAALGKMPAMAEFATDVGRVAGPLGGETLLPALKAARALERRIDISADRQYPVPCSRRNAPLVYDPANKVFVLFGGDHEDYFLNDTWVLDLAKGGWRRMSPELAPTGRAGHGLASLPGSGKIALYEGYVQSSSRDYGARAWRVVEPRQLWLYDVRADRWDLLRAWPAPKRRGGARPAPEMPPPAAAFYSYSAQHFSAPGLAADGADRLVLVVPAGRGTVGSTWLLQPDLSALDAEGRRKLGARPDGRVYRTGYFLAAYCEVPDEPPATRIDALPPNRWVKLPDVPRNTAYGCRQRDWGTAVWDAANKQILLWGGGHCVRSSSSVVHYSPVSGRMVESYDADEPYSANGNGGYDSSLLNRPWAGVHSYNNYAYDPPSGLMVSARGYVYDPARMDWLRREPMKRPFLYAWSHTVLEATPHGAVAWARHADKDRYGLWLYGKDTGWVDLKPKGRLFQPYCDSEGMVYDAKRDRLILGWGGGYAKAGDGSLTTFDFKTRQLAKCLPEARQLGRIRNTREMAYIDHADWVAFAEPCFRGERKAAKHYLRIYDCAKDRYFLLDAGDGPSRQMKVYGQGWCFDARRKFLFVLTYRGSAWAIRFDPGSAKLLGELPGAPKVSPLDKLGESLQRTGT